MSIEGYFLVRMEAVPRVGMRNNCAECEIVLEEL